MTKGTYRRKHLLGLYFQRDNNPQWETWQQTAVMVPVTGNLELTSSNTSMIHKGELEEQ